METCFKSIIANWFKDKEAQEERGRERLKTSWGRLGFRIIFTLAVTTCLVLLYHAILEMKSDRVIPLLIYGSIVALFLGHLVTTSFLKIMRNYIYYLTRKRGEEIDDIYTESLAIPAAVLGVVERVFFGALVAFNISATAAAMGAWLIVKMGTDWHRILDSARKESSIDKKEGENKIGPRSLAWLSLSAGVISLFFALIGGLICRKVIMPVPY